MPSRRTTRRFLIADPHQEARRSIDAGAVTGAAATAGPASALADIACSIPQSFCVLREGTTLQMRWLEVSFS